MLRCLFYVVNQRRFLPGTVPRLLLPRVNMLISSKMCNNITAASIGTMDIKITFCSKKCFLFLLQFKRLTSHKPKHLLLSFSCTMVTALFHYCSTLHWKFLVELWAKTNLPQKSLQKSSQQSPRKSPWKIMRFTSASRNNLDNWGQKSDHQQQNFFYLIKESKS